MAFKDNVGVTEELKAEMVECSPRVEIVVYIDPGESTAEDIKELLAALSDLHVANGGKGLTFRVA